MIYQMSLRQHVFAVILALSLLAFIFDLVRRRRLREEYSWLWVLAGVMILVMAAWQGALEFVTRLTGAVTPLTAVTVLGILFLMAVCIHLCTKLTEVNQQVKRLAQEVAILRAQEPMAHAPRPEDDRPDSPV